MKKITILMALFNTLSLLNIQAQSWEWAVTSASDEAFYNCTDNLGNVIQVGKFSGTVDFSGTTLTSGPGYLNWYIAKYNSNGVLQWAKKAMAGTGDREILALTTDASGNAIISGYFSTSAEITGTTITSVGDRDAFIAKYNSSGNLQWVKSGGGTYDENFTDLVCDPSGNVYATGFFIESATFDGNTLTGASVNFSSDGLLICYSPSGNVSFAKSFGGLSTDAGQSLAFYNDKLYLCGIFRSTAFVFQNLSLSWSGSGGDYDYFVSEINLSGQPQWLKGFTTETSAILFRKENRLAVNSSGIYFSGQFSNNINFGNGPLTSNSTACSGFLAKFDFLGNVSWAHAFTGHYLVTVKDVVATSDHLYALVNFTDTLSFQGQDYLGLFGNFSVAENNAFVASLSNSGTLEWFKLMLPYQNTSYLGTLRAESIAAYGNDLFVTASFSNTLTLETLSPATDGVNNNIDGLLAKIDINANGISKVTEPQITVYPNPASETIYVQAGVKDNYIITLLNTNGQIVMNLLSDEVSDFSLNVSSLSTGVYFLEVRSEKHISKSKLIIY